MNHIANVLSDKADDLQLDVTPVAPEPTLDHNRQEKKDNVLWEPELNEITPPPSPAAVQEEEKPTTTPTPAEEELNVAAMKSMIHSMKDQLDSMLRMLDGKKAPTSAKLHPNTEVLAGNERVLEGVFNGEKMIGEDGKEYSVPPNYASKSKLVEGDVMKLTITPRGSFLYKQIGPVERKRAVGELLFESESGQWRVHANGKKFNILTASATFYKGKAGDEVIILIPESGESRWAAVENIINK